MGLIEKISNEKPGFHSVLVKDSWQMVKVNYSQENHINNIHSLIINKNKGLAVSLLTGRAMLIMERQDEILPTIETIPMVRGTSYFIPENLGYNIVMERGCRLFGVEGPERISMDVRKRPLSNKEIEILKKSVNKEFKS